MHYANQRREQEARQNITPALPAHLLPIDNTDPEALTPLAASVRVAARRLLAALAAEEIRPEQVEHTFDRFRPVRTGRFLPTLTANRPNRGATVNDQTTDLRTAEAMPGGADRRRS